MKNQYIWSKNPDIRKWLVNNRLDGFTAMVQSVKFTDFKKIKTLKRFREHAKPAIAKLQQFMAELPQA